MKTVVIIGAGPSGLSAGYQLITNSKEYKIIILEKEKIVGGISKTVTYNGNRMDLGGHRFFTKNEEVLKLWKSFLPLQNELSINEKEDKVLLERNRISRIYYNENFFDYPITISFKTIKNLGFINTVTSGLSYLKCKLKKLPEDNLENFYINRFGRKLYNIFFKDYTKKVWGIAPKEIDASWGSQRVKGISIGKVLEDYFKRIFKIKDKNKEISLIEKFYYPKLGPGEMYEEMAHNFIGLGGTLKLNSEVIKIHKEKNNITSLTYKENGKTKQIKCDYLISSMPIKDLINALNNVPSTVKKIANNLPYRDFITIGIIFDKLKIKNNTKIKKVNNNIPDTWIYIQDKRVKLGRIQIFNNWSPYLVNNKKNISLGLEYFCNEEDNFWNLSNEKLKEYALNELEEIGIIDKDCIALDYHIEKVKKAYPAYFGSYKHFPKVKKYIDSINNLYCIGRNGMHRYNNMDHSIETGIICANNIINNITDNENIWQVNMENNYHEEIKRN